MPFYTTKELVDSVFDIAMPTLSRIMENSKGNLAIIFHPADMDLDEEPFYSKYFGDPQQRDKYHAFALAKARLSARTGLDTSVIISQFPDMLEAGDCIYGGGIDRDDIIVAASGLSEIRDETCCEVIASIYFMLIKEVHQERLKLASETGFIS